VAQIALADHHADDHHYTSTGLNHRKLLMWAFLGSDCMFFASLIATYLVYKGKDKVGPYPHPRVIDGQHYHGILDIPYTSVSAFVLLMSSVMMVLALAAIQRGDYRGLRAWLAATAGLGMVFLAGQVYEFTYFVQQEGLTLGTNLFGATFFVTTGFHGAHVTIGVIWLLSLLVRSLQGRLGQEHSLDVELAGLYWHFVDVVWIIIFTVLYLLP
jgi:cytochrome c oxidase subunit 3/cytochrome o ubiquinol oxidase subunit 3